MTIKEIKEMPQVLEEHKIHESVLQSYHLLNYVMDMIVRGDSKETIIEVVEYVRGTSNRQVVPKLNRQLSSELQTFK